LHSGEARLADAEKPGLSLESRFCLAYNAAHTLSLAALRPLGYRSNNRYVVFRVLPHTVGLPAPIWRVLAKCHDLRNVAEYEGAIDLEERLVRDLRDEAGTGTPQIGLPGPFRRRRQPGRAPQTRPRPAPGTVEAPRESLRGDNRAPHTLG